MPKTNPDLLNRLLDSWDRLLLLLQVRILFLSLRFPTMRSRHPGMWRLIGAHALATFFYIAAMPPVHELPKVVLPILLGATVATALIIHALINCLRVRCFRVV